MSVMITSKETLLKILQAYKYIGVYDRYAGMCDYNNYGDNLLVKWSEINIRAYEVKHQTNIERKDEFITSDKTPILNPSAETLCEWSKALETWLCQCQADYITTNDQRTVTTIKQLHDEINFAIVNNLQAYKNAPWGVITINEHNAKPRLVCSTNTNKKRN